jgi:hypothetical protein
MIFKIIKLKTILVTLKVNQIYRTLINIKIIKINILIKVSTFKN